MSYIAVIGAGSWGTTIAVMLAKKDFDLSLWVYEEDLACEMDETRVNRLYLPDCRLPENIKISSKFNVALKDARFIISVVPTQHVRQILTEAASSVPDGASFVSASKGVENGTLKRPSEIILEIFPDRNVSVMSGPSFASEVIRERPTAVSLASADHKEAMLFQELLNTGYFRVYTNQDIIGVELGGALKNVIAIASGISDGLSLGNNARAALITRGLAEMRRLGVAMGARENTFSGLSGMGDLVLTCTANLSRNYTFGMKLAQGMKAKEILAQSRSVAEGVQTSKSVIGLMEKYDVEMPISLEIYRVIFEDKSPARAVQDLMGRALKHEFYG
jgi:glycerol-3-phosphate dehydrogenase (NAD(P)+)